MQTQRSLKSQYSNCQEVIIAPCRSRRREERYWWSWFLRTTVICCLDCCSTIKKLTKRINFEAGFEKIWCLNLKRLESWMYCNEEDEIGFQMKLPKKSILPWSKKYSVAIILQQVLECVTWFISAIIYGMKVSSIHYKVESIQDSCWASAEPCRFGLTN